MKISNLYIVTICLLLFTSCQWFKFKQEKSENENVVAPIARANDKYLYPQDLEGIIAKDMSSQDSSRRANNYIKSWFKKQLIISEAEKKIDFNEVEIERKILDYKYALMAHEFEKQYVNDNLDTLVTRQEIEKYYQEKQDNFQLKQNIIKGTFVKLPVGAPKLNRFKKLYRSVKEKDREELKSYCVQFAQNFLLEEEIWVNFDEVIIDTPLASIPNKVQFLKNNKYYESSDENALYFLQIREYKISDQISPLEFVEDQIKNIIIHRRKVELVNQLEDDIYEKANENSEIEIFSN